MKLLISLSLVFLLSGLHAQMWPACEGEMIYHSYYTLCYDEAHEQAFWVAYMLTPQMISNKVTKRTNNFRIDTTVSTGSAELSDYKKSGYDRGHLCPAGDMGFDKNAMSESFYLSNMSPQIASFNRGIWRFAEEQTRKWVMACDSILVITGPLFFSDTSQTIGGNEVGIAEYYFKALLIYSGNLYLSMAYLMPHVAGLKGPENYLVSIDSLELFTEYNFYSELPDSVELEMESKVFDFFLKPKK